LGAAPSPTVAASRRTELIRPEQINQAYDRVVAKDARYRFVIDLTMGKKV
jgi:D-arabinose 1-dehydrogenase-like Zn-dependent alcohol dehydrogenase